MVFAILYDFVNLKDIHIQYDGKNPCHHEAVGNMHIPPNVGGNCESHFQTNKMKPVITILFILVILPNVTAQKVDINNFIIEKSSFSANIMGSSSLGGITFEKVLTDIIIWEVGIGYVGIGTGVTYYPFNIQKSKVCPYTGLKFSFLVLPEVAIASWAYIPLGVTFFSKQRINIGFDVGPALGKMEDVSRPVENWESSLFHDRKIRIFGNLKVGFRL